MISIQKKQFDHAFLLLPWYITGKLTEQEREEVEDALSRSPELQQQLEQEKHLAQLVSEDHEVLDIVTITTQEQRLENLLERINQEHTAKKVPHFGFSDFSAKLKDWLSWVTPSFLPQSGWGQVAIAVFIVVQVAVVMMVYNHTSLESKTKYELVSDSAYNPSDKTVLIVQFTPHATKEQIQQLFDEIGVEKADNPAGSTHYKIVLSSSLREQELDKLINRLEKKTDLVQLIGKGL